MTLHGCAASPPTARSSGSLLSGDRIQLTAPNRELAASPTATLARFSRSTKTAGSPSAWMATKSKSFASIRREMRHFDHGYAVTSHSSQGLTSERVLVNMDTEVHPELINRRFAYVSVSRASHDAQIFTNDAATLAESLSRDVSKASAIDFGKSQSQVASSSLEQAAAVKPSPATGLGLSL